MSTASQPNSGLSNIANSRGGALPISMLEGARKQPIASGSHPYAHALAVIRKLQHCLDEETATLTKHGVAELDNFNQRKGQGLMELNRALAGYAVLQRNGEVEAELGKLKLRINENMRHLRLHISAVNEITAMLTDAIQKEESDGTYSPSIRAHWK